MTLEAGTRLGPYEIVKLRGKGGMGEVRDSLRRQLVRRSAPPDGHGGMRVGLESECDAIQYEESGDSWLSQFGADHDTNS